MPLTRGADPHDRKPEIRFICDREGERNAMAECLAEPDNSTLPPVLTRATERAIIHGQFRRMRFDGGVKSTESERD